eukprot:694778-Pleurochrysis_carterae.AAC.4
MDYATGARGLGFTSRSRSIYQLGRFEESARHAAFPFTHAPFILLLSACYLFIVVSDNDVGLLTTPQNAVGRITESPTAVSHSSTLNSYAIYTLHAASRTFDKETNVCVRRVLLYYPHRSNDMLHVPQIFPPLANFLPEIAELTREHGLAMSPDGGLAL